ncbi:hypothetical protein AAZX31_07G125500 [Glycine max]|nr:hypothetical protein GLYMA_07G132800v4 [Glycine max]KAG5022531.1 hypothetical protein JHK85_018873 [Glycine max]KAG5037626.1 hypothetical protein JHK86_018466 [Glycine max]KAG5106446.1 hypothetical protein JHK82_043416 [Glycine max]KAG5142745.1 hypothetical protein JHK82_018440 [Glycine max]
MNIAPHSSITLEGEPRPSLVQLRVNSRQWRKVVHVHQMEIDPSFPSKVEHRELKHFKEWFPWLFPSLSLPMSLCSSSPCMSMIAPTFLPLALPLSSVVFSFQPFNENPLLGPSLYTLRNMGALDVNKVVHRHQGWRLITCMWLHGGIFHLLANMFGLLVIGIRLEKEFGFACFLLFSLGKESLLVLLVLFFDLLGGMLSELLTNWSLYEKKLGALFIAINLAVGVLPHVDNFAHIGGFLSGFLVGFVFLIRPQFGWIKQRNAPQPHSPTLIKSKFNKYQCISWILALILLIFGFTTGLISLLRCVDANDYCSWCHYLSCIPTSRWNCNPKASSSVVVSICAEISSSELPVSKELGVKKKQCSS